MHAVEAHAEQMLDVLRCTPSVPARWLVCTRDGRQARDGTTLPSASRAPVLRSLRIGELAMTQLCGGRPQLRQSDDAVVETDALLACSL